MSKLRKLWKFLSSMKFGMLLLGILALICVLGSVIPQGKSLDWYLQNSPERTAALIWGTRFDDVFHSLWFLVLTVILLCNLMLCNLLHLPALLSRCRKAADPASTEKAVPTVEVPGLTDPKPVFARLRMPEPRTLEREEKKLLFSVKNRIGLWGAWVCHLGILLLILGFTLGQTNKIEYTVYGVAGQTKAIGETGFSLTIDAFDVTWTESGTPDQFSTAVTVRDPDGETQSATVRVNEPGTLFGYTVFQNSTGDAARLTVLQNGEVLQDEVLSQGDYLVIQDTPVAVFFEGWEAEAHFDDGSVRSVYDYALYDMTRDAWSESRYQEEGGVAVQTSVYEIRFSDHQSYTLLQLKQDPYTWLALLGGLIVLIGLILSFYLSPRTLWAEEQPDGTWTLFGRSRKAGPLFAEQVRDAAKPSQPAP